ncbi:hypothetical protein Tco_1342448 [Tanacetum coccineum]
MPYDSPLLEGYTPGSVEGNMQLKELMNLCTKLVARVTSLETKLKKTKEVHGKAFTKLVKKVKRLEDKLKSTNKRKKGRIEEAEDTDVEKEYVGVEYDFELTEQQVTPLKAPQVEVQSQETFKAELSVLSAAKIIFRVEALQTKYPIIDWEIHTEDSRKYWKIIRVSNITEAYQSFEDMLKAFDKEELDTLWSLVKEKFRSAEPTKDMEKALWVELKRLYEPDKEDALWKLQRYMHDPLTWRLYGSCAVYYVFLTRGHYIYMFPEKDYPLTNNVMMLMLCRRLQVEEDNPGVPASQAQAIIPHNAAFQTEDLNTYDSDCDDLLTAQAVLMANVSNYDFDIILEVPNSETYLNDMENQSVHALQDFEQSPVMEFIDNEISSDSNIIPYSQYYQETQHATVQDTNLQAQQDSMILSVIEQISEQMINHVNNSEKANKEQNNETITAELERYKERVKTFEQRLNYDLSSHEKMIDSQINDMIREKLALKEQIYSLEQNLSK